MFKYLIFLLFRINYEEAIEIINKKQDLDPLIFGQDLSQFHMKKLLEYFDEIPIFVTHFPENMQPFYVKSEKETVS